MLKIIFLFMVFVHGLIHLLGFIKAFNLVEIKELTMSVSRPMGLLWLVIALLFFVFGVLYLTASTYWWLPGMVAVIASQLVIFLWWGDAKYGTIPNVLILMVAVVGFGYFHFESNIQKEINQLLSHPRSEEPVLSNDMIADLPEPVQKWLQHSGAVGRDIIHHVYSEQRYQLRLDPAQERWYHGSARQFVSIRKPSFVWIMHLQMMPLIGVVGRDKFMDGRGEMLIKVLSLIPVVHEKDNHKINQGTLQRYLGEIVWYPSAAVEPYITWEALNENAARATMTYKGTSGSGTFYFDDAGDFIRFSALRYMGSDDDAEQMEWIIEAKESRVINGIRVPTKCSAIWRLESGDWTWADIEVLDIRYNG